MPRRSIGIDFNSNRITAVQMSRTGGRYRVEKTWSAPMRRQSDKPDELLKTLISEKDFDRRASCAVALPHRQLFMRRKPDINEPHAAAVPSPIDGPQTEMDLTSAASEHPITTVMPDGLIEQCLRPFQENRLRCETLVPAVSSLLTAFHTTRHEKDTCPAIILYADEKQTLILLLDEQGELFLTRSFPNIQLKDTDKFDIIGLVREIEISWRCAHHNIIPENTLLYLSGLFASTAGVANALTDELDCTIITMDNTANIMPAPGCELAPSLTIAEGLALQALNSDARKTPNALRINARNTSTAGIFRRQIAVCAALLLVTAGLWLFQLLHYRVQLENQYRSLKAQSQALFTQTLPGEATIVDETQQMQQHLNALQEQLSLFEPYLYDTSRPLDVLYLLSANTPADLKLDIVQCAISSDKVTLNVLADDYEAPYTWQQTLTALSEFEHVHIENPTRDKTTKRISFTAGIVLSSERSIE